MKFRTIKEENKKVEILSEAISKFIRELGYERFMEGAFIIPYANHDGIQVLLLEIVYNHLIIPERISRTDKFSLQGVYADTGINIKVESIPYWWYTKNCIKDCYDYPIRGMLKSGNIIYDVNGNLKKQKEKLKSDELICDLSSHGVVIMEPPIQYKKEK